MVFFVMFLIVLILGIILLFVNYLLGRRDININKLEVFECGFVGFEGQTRNPFSISFYIVGILFLIFDLEIALIFPYAVCSYEVGVYGMWVVLVFLVVLTLGFVYEFSVGVLKLVK